MNCCVIFGKMLNLFGLHMCYCKQERLAEGYLKELKDVEIPRGRGKSTGEQRGTRVMTKVLNQSRESVPGSRQTVSWSFGSISKAFTVSRTEKVLNKH